MRIRLAILETDQSFTSRLVRYFATYYADKVETFSFTDAEEFQKSLQTAKVDVLLASPELFPEGMKLPKNMIMAYLSESSQVQSINNVRAICKYQKAEMIYREVLGLYAELDKMTVYRQAEGACPLFFFKGAAGGVGATTLAIACAMRFASYGKKVLYLNLEENGVVSPFLQGDGTNTLSDVLYALKSNRSNLVLKLERMVRKSEEGIYFFEPFAITLDAYEMETEDLEDIIRTVIGYDTYDAVILDGGFAGSDKNDAIMKYASEIFLVSDGMEIPNLKLTKILQELSIKDDHAQGRVLARTQVLYNRFAGASRKADTEYQERVYGGVGIVKGAAPKQVAAGISQSNFFDKLIQRWGL